MLVQVVFKKIYFWDKMLVNSLDQFYIIRKTDATDSQLKKSY